MLSRHKNLIVAVLLASLLALLSLAVFANESSVLKGFNEGVASSGALKSFEEIRWQHKVLFFMGIALLICILATATFGIQMAMFGKQVFVPHMIFAGLTVFLSIAHAVVAVVWFNPFK